MAEAAVATVVSEAVVEVDILQTRKTGIGASERSAPTAGTTGDRRH